jgi:hypothetical protein
MFLTNFYPHQKEENLRAFLKSCNENIAVLSYKSLNGIPHGVVNLGDLAPQDDAFNVYLSVLSSGKLIAEQFTLIDWEVIEACSDLQSEISKLKMTRDGFEIVQENITVQDFRFAPFMENLLKVCNDLQLKGLERLFSENPKLILPKVIRGSKDVLIEVLNRFSIARSQFSQKTFNGCIPIFNSEFSII